MNARVEIRDTRTNKVLEIVCDNLHYDNPGIAIQNCNNWYADNVEKWAAQNYWPQIVLVDR